jgi:hypothetical protein
MYRHNQGVAGDPGNATRPSSRSAASPQYSTLASLDLNGLNAMNCGFKHLQYER